MVDVALLMLICYSLIVSIILLGSVLLHLLTIRFGFKKKSYIRALIMSSIGFVLTASFNFISVDIFLTNTIYNFIVFLIYATLSFVIYTIATKYLYGEIVKKMIMPVFVFFITMMISTIALRFVSIEFSILLLT